MNVTAELSGVLFKDECKAVVEDGNAVEPGKYTASIVGLTGEQMLIIMCFMEMMMSIRWSIRS